MTNTVPLVTEFDYPAIGEMSTATFSACRVYRYALTRRWSGAPLAAFVMLNPSTADAFKADPTVRRCIGFARRWSAGGVLVLNLFALRSTDPQALYGHADPVGPANDVVIAGSLTDQPIGPVIAAWRNHGALRSRGRRVAALLRADGHRVLCLGTTKHGDPRHPLYVRSEVAPVELAVAS